MATCCKPISRAGVVWMNMKHREVWINPDHEKGNPFIKGVLCAYVLPLSHYTRALKSRKTKAFRVARRSGAQGRGSESHERTRPLSPQSCNNDCIHTMCLFCAWWKSNHCNCARIYMIVCVYCNFTSENKMMKKSCI